MHDLVNGLHVTLRKYRRGADSAHYDFVGSLYPALGVSLPAAIGMARVRYPTGRGDFLGTTLCISNDTRVKVNARVNGILSMGQAEAVFVPEPKAVCHEAKKPQDMYVWPGIVLMARCKSGDPKVTNGIRYLVSGIPDGEFELTPIDDNDEATGKSESMDADELSAKMRLTHAITDFPSQARTIHNGLRLTDTDKARFSIRHLIVGLGRAPVGGNVEVQ